MLLDDFNSSSRGACTSGASILAAMKPSSRKPLEAWQVDDARRLKTLWEARQDRSVSQERFAADHDIGTQGAFWQYLHGRIPLNLGVAIKIARGLGCAVQDFSPTLAGQLAETQAPYVLPAQEPPPPREADAGAAQDLTEWSWLLSQLSPAQRDLLKLIAMEFAVGHQERRHSSPPAAEPNRRKFFYSPLMSDPTAGQVKASVIKRFKTRTQQEQEAPCEKTAGKAHRKGPK
jgi:transcriptional regulator with XRE-family HTH domain